MRSDRCGTEQQARMASKWATALSMSPTFVTITGARYVLATRNAGWHVLAGGTTHKPLSTGGYTQRTPIGSAHHIASPRTNTKEEVP